MGMMPPPHINIVLSDRNWILERLGKELQDRLRGIVLSDVANPSADINYYITFACRKAPAPTLEMGLFTHMEQLPELQARFIETARELDLSVCMSAKYRDILHENGITSTALIAPGVDLDQFTPKLRIGIVGRAYHTGRKGEALLAQLMDMNGIDWHFTGTGWPKPGRFIPDVELPDFYRSMDYILVPALYEGGPMCVPEALAVGTPVIASDVGWVSDFPHIPFKTGDADDLRRVLEDLLKAKQDLRASTAHQTWDAYAELHDAAFRKLLESRGRTGRSAPKESPFSGRVKLLLHGDEATTLGGPSVRVPKTVDALQALGVQATHGVLHKHESAEHIDEDVVHLFNVWQPNTALDTMRKLKAAGKTVVFSPIYLDLSERPFWHKVLPEADIEDFDVIRSKWDEHIRGRGRLAEPTPGYNAMVSDMLNMADHVIFLSQSERKGLSKIGATVPDDRSSIVRNPVDADRWAGGDPRLFRKTYLDHLPDSADYVICTGRIETRKNQLMLARAMKTLDLHLVLVGHAGDTEYAQRVRDEAGIRLIEIGRLESGGEMLRSAMAGARVFALPSWSEGASLAALEAAATGANMVLSDRSSEREYFGDLAEYCDPGDASSIKAALERALSASRKTGPKSKIAKLVHDEYSWQRYAKDTANAYAKARKAPPRNLPAASSVQPVHPKQIVLDVTTLAHHRGRPTGISRVESQLAKSLLAKDTPVKLIFWNDAIKKFLELPREFCSFENAFRYRGQFDDRFDVAPVTLVKDDCIVVAGSAWMQNGRYVRGLEDLKARSGATLLSVLYDLVPLKFPFWFNPDYAPVFRENFHRLTSISDGFMTDSKSCAADLQSALATAPNLSRDITVLRLGDPASKIGSTSKEASASVQKRFGQKKFILAVGAIHTRKNYDLLYRIWTRYADEGRHGDLHLVLIGGIAWNGHPLAERIQQDTRVNRTIHILSDVDDTDLDWFYEHCLFTVFPSHYEGWGLPVAESLVHGKLCLATNSSSVPEIAPDFVEHIDPEDFATWHARISFYATSGHARDAKERDIREGYKPVSWDHTVDQLQSAVQSTQNRQGLVALYPGQPTGAGTEAPPMSLQCGQGWHPAESFGRWSAAETTSISVNASRIDKDGRAAFYVLLKLRTYLRNRMERLEISSRGMSLFAAEVTQNNCPDELILKIPTSHIDADGLVSLDFCLPISPETNKQNETKRSLGVGIVSICLLDDKFSNPLHLLNNPKHWAERHAVLRYDMRDGSHRDVVARGLGYSPGWGVGTNRARAQIFLPILFGATFQRMTISLRPIARPDKPVTGQISWNGMPIFSQTWTDDTPVTLTSDDLRQDEMSCAPAMLTLETNSFLTPADLGLGNSQNLAGVGILDILFE